MLRVLRRFMHYEAIHCLYLFFLPLSVTLCLIIGCSDLGTTFSSSYPFSNVLVKRKILQICTCCVRSIHISLLYAWASNLFIFISRLCIIKTSHTSSNCLASAVVPPVTATNCAMRSSMVLSFAYYMFRYARFSL